MKKASRDQIIEVVRQLGNGEMDAGYAQAVIEHRFASSGVSIRETQARRLYDLKFGDVLGVKTFEAYLDGTDAIEAVPQIPNFPEVQVRHFGRDGVYLVDGRVAAKIGLKEYCNLVGLVYYGEDDTFESHDSKRVNSGIRWMIGQDGFRNRGRKPNDCREAFASFEVGMDAIEGIGVYTQNPNMIIEHYPCLPGSAHREIHNACAYLGVIDGKPKLFWSWGDGSSPGHGSASRGE